MNFPWLLSFVISVLFLRCQTSWQTISRSNGTKIGQAMPIPKRGAPCHQANPKHVTRPPKNRPPWPIPAVWNSKPGWANNAGCRPEARQSNSGNNVKRRDRTMSECASYHCGPCLNIPKHNLPDHTVSSPMGHFPKIWRLAPELCCTKFEAKGFGEAQVKTCQIRGNYGLQGFLLL